MIIEFLTLFPGFFDSPLSESILKRAADAGVVTFKTRDIREYAEGKHRVADDTPFGGGAGMVMKIEPLVGAVEAAGGYSVLLTPAGAPFTQAVAADLAARPHIALVCGRYEGVDDRISDFVDLELSVGDYVLSGGEPAALSVADACVRLLPGALGDPDSPREESFSDGLLEYPQFTRPREFRGAAVPDVLLSGDHQAIRRWRRAQSLSRTQARRPDLLAAAALTSEDRELLKEIRSPNGEDDHGD